jgi:3-oxoacyl-[acyl-carrier-protein] synthase III
MENPVIISAFASVFGEERLAESIEGFQEQCEKEGLVLGMSMMGCESFTEIKQPMEEAVMECIQKTIQTSGILPEEVDKLILTTIDRNLKHLDANFIKAILDPIGLKNCVPLLFSMQQCVSSVSAIDYGVKLFDDPKTKNIIVVSFDKVYEESDRIRSFALFGDAVTSCLLSKDGDGLSMLSYQIGLDFDGVMGTDNFESRKKMFKETSDSAFENVGSIEDVIACFSTNLYRPIAQFNTSVSGLRSKQLYIETLKEFGHCGNCDWMMNLEHYQNNIGFQTGQKYMIQSFAPGFFAASVLEYQ